ncbi:unnamed protein product [Amoebophrya sp. A120]|nr:unnamed protein product [Amoebophrya sp. A120]|eukprot:GSA120T00002434001.1
MPHSFGKRARCRDKFSKAFRTKGRAGLSTYLTPFKRGDYVDIKCDPSQQKGMPYQFYHGRTGVIYNVTKSAVGVELTKVVGNRQLRKRLHVRIEHVRRSRCNEDFLKRVKETDKIKAEANKKGEKIVVKRMPECPKPSEIIKARQTVTEVFAPLEFVANHF